MTQIAPESVHVCPSADLPGGTTAADLEGSRFELVESQGCAGIEPAALRTGGPVPWVRSADLAVLASAAEAYAEGSPVVLECPPGLVLDLAGGDRLVAVCPDDVGAQPGGALEAVVTAAVVDGARLVRSVHGREVRRCLHVAAALLLEQRGAA
jgi:hypothetical protein